MEYQTYDDGMIEQPAPETAPPDTYAVPEEPAMPVDEVAPTPEAVEEPVVADSPAYDETSTVPSDVDGSPVAQVAPATAQESVEAPALVGQPTEGQASTGGWWSAAAEPASCCIMPAELAGVAPAEQPPGLEFVDAAGQPHALPGVDTTSSGQADSVAMDANQDGAVDTWMFDTTNTGTADLMLFDSTGTGQADCVSFERGGTGDWAPPLPVAGLEQVASDPTVSPEVLAPDAGQLDTVAQLNAEYQAKSPGGEYNPFGYIYELAVKKSGSQPAAGAEVFSGRTSLAELMNSQYTANSNLASSNPNWEARSNTTTGEAEWYKQGDLTPSEPNFDDPINYS